MDADPLIAPLPEPGKPASRLELLQRVSHLQTKPSAIPGEVVHFCKENILQGPVVTKPDIQVLGRVQSLDALVNAPAHPSSGLTHHDSLALARDLVAMVDDRDTRLRRQKAALAGLSLSKRPMWSYLPANAGNPFDELGASRKTAIDTLGLGYFAYVKPAAEIVRWAHTLPDSIVARKPTAWDAGTSPGNVYWRPGGRTYRLTTETHGVPEVVHDSITGDDLVQPMEVLA